MEDKTKNSLRQIIDYLHDDEEKHWQASDTPEPDHIFHDFIRVRMVGVSKMVGVSALTFCTCY
jgi:hypothetical protein